MGVVKVVVNGVTKMDITPTTADASEVNQGEVFFNRSGEQSVGTSDHAKEQQIAYVESGTTASRAYAVGEYFCWNGLLYRAKTAISSGGTFTPGTNCEQVTGGAANSLANQIVIESLTLSNTGSVSPDTNAVVTTTIPAKTGYAPVACLPGYSGDDQFCWVACALTSNNTQVSATVRNVSSSADSGAPRVFIIYQKV